MEIVSNLENDNNTEQITNKNNQIGQLFYNVVSKILQKDELGLFNLKSALDLEQKNKDVNSRIQKLISNNAKINTRRSNRYNIEVRRSKKSKGNVAGFHRKIF